METHKGFIAIPALLAIVFSIVVLGGSAYLLYSPKTGGTLSTGMSTTGIASSSSENLAGTGNEQLVAATPLVTENSPGQIQMGTPSIAKIPAVTDITQRTPFHITTASGRLFLYSGETQFIPLTGVSRNNAESICFKTFASRCLFEGGELSANSGPTASTLKILSPISGATVMTSSGLAVKIKDEGLAGEYHIYLAHHSDVDGRIDQVYEGHLTSVSGTEFYTLDWDLRSVSLDGGNFLAFKSFLPGLYNLIVVNKDTAASASTVILLKDSANKYPLVKAYTEGTPLYNDPSWDGRGIFMDGDGGVDTLTLAGKRSEYDIYRGTDMPSKNQYNTIVLRQNISGAVIVAVNDEILKFDDITLSIPALTPIAN